jgi:hypothetical protein
MLFKIFEMPDILFVCFADADFCFMSGVADKLKVKIVYKIKQLGCCDTIAITKFWRGISQKREQVNKISPLLGL